jgi:glycosyltransferase involved in cell wall biosynthesis
LGFPVENSDKGITPSELVDVSFYGVEYLGDTDDVSHFLSFAHCVVLPTLYGEGVPKSLIEGAASGCALISSDGAGCSRIVKNGINGLLVNPNFEDEILLAIEKYYLLPQTEKEQLSINSRKIVEEEFDERIVIDAYKIVAE